MIPLIVSSSPSQGRDTQAEPITIGLPLPRGLVQDAARLQLVDADGERIALQASPTERWADGSLRFVLCDFLVAGPFLADRRFTLRVAESPAPERNRALSVVEGPDGVSVDTTAGQFLIGRGSVFPFARVRVAGTDLLNTADSALIVTDRGGSRHAARFTQMTVEHQGICRAAIRLTGTIGPATSPLQVIARLHFFAGSAAVRVAVTLRNPQRARHRGGFWELGDNGSIFFRDASVRLAWPEAASSIACAAEIDSPTRVCEAPVELYQDSSGGEQWAHITHMNRRGEVPHRFRGYRMTTANGVAEGLRATPALLVQNSGGQVGIAVQHFWQNFPAAITAEAQALRFQFFPPQFADIHELQGGEQKTHRFTLIFGGDPMARDAWFWGRTPSSARATPEWYCSTAVVPHLSPAAGDPDARYQQLVGAALDGPESFECKRERIDEYGWRNFGDIYADHENAYTGSSEPIVSHYNNQYDGIAGCAYQFMRTGDQRWQRMMDELATHVCDIDIYHTDRDKSAYNHGLFWHTAHYLAAGRSSHRTYPRTPASGGGGPSNEHNYTSGLRLHWLLTGDPESRDAAINLARWVIAMDDGRRTIFRWLASGPTGVASQTRSPDFHGPGRGAGNSILALLDGHRLTGDAAFLTKAEELIRRTIHPQDDIAAFDLLNAEERWSYTVYLQALGKYLDYKAELGAVDAHYAYARASLLHYARWMADHEYPYLDRPEILQYPTETWAAQDVRKCEVFLYAAAHAPDADRGRFLERSRFFYESSLSTLRQSPTRTLARPVVLLLSNGFMALNSRSTAPRPHPLAMDTIEFGMRPRFVPQKARARQRVKSTAAAVLFALATIGVFAFV